MIRRLIGWAIVLVGLLVLARDILFSIDIKHWSPITLGQLWFDLNPSSLDHVQALMVRYLPQPHLWIWIIDPILLRWAFPVLMVLGVLVLAVSAKRRRAPDRPGAT